MAPVACSHRPSLLVCALAGGIMITAQGAWAQCWDWHSTPGVSGPDLVVYGMTLWDPDGLGPTPPVLVLGGTFDMAGTTPANNIATWDGHQFAALGAGLDGWVDALAVMQNGELVAAGNFLTAGGVTVNRIARWNGSAWLPLGPGGPATGLDNQVNALAVLQNGDVVAGGFFTTAGGVSVHRVARWDGTAWSEMGYFNNIVWALLTMPNGDLIAGGQFTGTASVPANKLARWNGAAWSSLGGVNSTVTGLGVDSDGNLVVGGQFTYCGVPANHVARLTGATWSALGLGVQGPVWSFANLPNGHLVAGGIFFFAGGQNIESIAAWDGANWNALGAGLSQYPDTVASVVMATASLPNGHLMVGGVFSTAGGNSSPNLARWAPDDPCDTNCDGSVNGFDIQPFVEGLEPNPPAPCSPCAGDVNGDGSVNGFDIQGFVDRLSA